LESSIEATPLVLHYTHAMRKRFDVPAVTEHEVPTLPHLSWYTHFFIAQRVHFVLTTNAASLFTVVLYKSGLRDEGDFITAFLRNLGDHLEDIGLSMIFDRVIAPRTGAITIAKTFDRRVLGSQNDMIQIIKHHADLEELSPWDLSQNLNKVPFSAIDYLKPREAIARLPVR